MTALSREWATAPDLASMALPGLPATPANVRALSERERWGRADWAGAKWRIRQEKGGGREFHYSVLPPAAREAWIAAFTPVGEAAELAAAQASGSAASALWADYLRAPEAAREKALAKLKIVVAVQEAIASGRPRTNAVLSAATEFSVGKSIIYQWLGLVDGLPRADWAPALLARHKGRTVRADCTDEAWNALYVEYMRPSAPAFSSCYRKIVRAAEKNGWTLPSEAACRRRMGLIKPEVHALNRRGADFLKRMYPAQERDRTVFHALQAVNADGHKWDVFVRWPDGFVGRPMMVGFQDLYSDMFLSWRVDRSENRDLIRLAFGDMVEAYGLPTSCYLDNGRGFASKQLTGGIRNRFRFKYREEEPDGIMTQLGVQVHWATPYAGQSKPIERGFGDLARDVAKDIRFEGAYTGNNPLAKPENYGSKAVPLDVFLQVVGEGIREHNARVGRRTKVCGGKLSFQQAFEASYAGATIQKCTAQQRQLWLLAAEGLKPRRIDGSIQLMGNRYWADFCSELAGKQVTVRFDPDQLQADLHVYRTDGVYLGAAPCVEAVGFNDVEAARLHARARTSWMRATKAADAAQRRMSAAEQIALTVVDTTPPAPPETKVVRAVFGNNARMAVAVQAAEHREIETEDLFVQAVARQRAARGAHLQIVDEEN